MFAVQNFFSDRECEQLIREMLECSVTPVLLADDTINETQRKAGNVSPSETTRNLVEQKLDDLKPSVEEHFRLRLTTFEEPQFLIYGAGDFHCAHSDKSTDPTHPTYVKQREISVVVLLNGDSAAHATTYGGGVLTLYGLSDDQAWKSFGFQLEPEPGLLVAFRSDLVHEVTPITSGQRFSIVTWFA